MTSPRAYLLTFRTYGTWLHGDDRGSVDRHHNTYATPTLPANDRRRHWELARQSHEPVLFDDRMRVCVDGAIRDECGFRGWVLIELNVRTNHVHAVLNASDVVPEQTLAKLKARATQMLRREGLVAQACAVWASGTGSRRYLWNDDQVREAADYVRLGQDVRR